MGESFVTIEQRQCAVCGEIYDTGNLLFDNKLRKQFEKNTVVGYGICGKCRAVADQGYAFLVEANILSENEIREQQGKKPLKKKSANKPCIPVPAGRVMRLKRGVVEKVFDVEVKHMAFMAPEAFEQIIEMATDDDGAPEITPLKELLTVGNKEDHPEVDVHA